MFLQQARKKKTMIFKTYHAYPYQSRLWTKLPFCSITGICRFLQEVRIITDDVILVRIHRIIEERRQKRDRRGSENVPAGVRFPSPRAQKRAGRRIRRENVRVQMPRPVVFPSARNVKMTSAGQIGTRRTSTVSTERRRKSP